MEGWNRFGVRFVAAAVGVLLVLGACGVDLSDSAAPAGQSVGRGSVEGESAAEVDGAEPVATSNGQSQVQHPLELEPVECDDTVFFLAERCWVVEVVEEQPDLSGDRIYLDVGVSGSDDSPSVVLLASVFAANDLFPAGHQVVRIGVRGTGSSPLELRCKNGPETCEQELAATGVDVGEYSLARRAAETSTVLGALAAEIGLDSYGLVAVGASVPLGQLIAAEPPDGLDQVVLVPDRGFGATGRQEVPARTMSAWMEFVQTCVEGSRCVSEQAVVQTVETLTEKSGELYDVSLGVDDTIRALLLSGAGSLAAIAASSSDPASVPGWLVGGSVQPTLLSLCDQSVGDGPCPEPSRLGVPATDTTLVRSAGGLRVGNLAGVSIVDVPALGANVLDAVCGRQVVRAVVTAMDVPEDCLVASPWARYDSLVAGVILESTTIELYSGVALSLSTPKFWRGSDGFLSRDLSGLDSTWVTLSDVARDGLDDVELFDLAIEQTYLLEDYGLFDGRVLSIDDGQDWGLFRDDNEYFSVSLAVRLYADFAIVVQLETDPDEHDELVRDLLVPMIDSIEIEATIEQ